jgi:hypothetical protein
VAVDVIFSGTTSGVLTRVSCVARPACVVLSGELMFVRLAMASDVPIREIP